jgi:hypothetical protein
VAAAVFRRVERRLAACGEPSSRMRRFVESAPLLVALAGASTRGVVATGPRRGCRIVRVRGAPVGIDVFVMGRLCAQIEGYNLQAATRLAANDRNSLERMARYLARPPVATDRLSELADGGLELRLKRPWRDGTTAFRFQPTELIERLVALVPRPRAHLVRYSGVFAPAFGLRSQIVPSQERTVAAGGGEPPPAGFEKPKRLGRIPWAPLLWRVLSTVSSAAAAPAGCGSSPPSSSLRRWRAFCEAWGSPARRLPSRRPALHHRVRCRSRAPPPGSSQTHRPRTTSAADGVGLIEVSPFFRKEPGARSARRSRDPCFPAPLGAGSAADQKPTMRCDIARRTSSSLPPSPLPQLNCTTPNRSRAFRARRWDGRSPR